MDKIFARAEDKHVRHYKIYSKASDTYAYSDSDCTKKLTTTEMKNAYIKGAIVDIAGKMYTAIGYSETGGVGTMLFMTESSGSAELLKLNSEAE